MEFIASRTSGKSPGRVLDFAPWAISLGGYYLLVWQTVVENWQPGERLGFAIAMLFPMLVTGFVAVLVAKRMAGLVAKRMAGSKAPSTTEKFIYQTIAESSGTVIRKPLAPVAEQLRYRATRLRTQATLFLVVLVAVIVGGVLIYINAQNISASYADRSTYGIVQALRELGDASERIRRRVAEVEESGRYDKVTAELREILNETKSALQEVQMMRQQSEESQKLQFYSTLSTRVGAVLMLVFLAQFLINAYRYTLRLSAAYHSKADALSVEWEDAQAARRFMSVDEFGFDRVKAPTQEALEIAKQLIDKRSPR